MHIRHFICNTQFGNRHLGRALCAAALTALAPICLGLGLGNAELRSWLNEPLDVSIPIIEPGRYGINDFAVRQLTGEQARVLGYTDAIYDQPYLFAVKDAPDGSLWLHGSSRQPVKEPFVSFLLQLQLPSGSIQREYTLLIDMPPESAPSQALAPYSPSKRLQSPPSPTTSSPSASNTSSATTKPAQQTFSGADYNVKIGDTLGEIAQRVRPDEAIRLDAIISSLYQLNPQAFENGNINRLLVGSRLMLPNQTQYADMPLRNGWQLSTLHSSPASVSSTDTDIYTDTEITDSETSSTNEAPLATVEPSSFAASNQSYTVKSGDTLSQIADRIRPSNSDIPLTRSIDALLTVNAERFSEMGSNTTLQAGETLTLPNFAATTQTSNRSSTQTTTATNGASSSANSARQVSQAAPTPARINNNLNDNLSDNLLAAISDLQVALESIDQRLTDTNQRLVSEQQLSELMSRVITLQQQQLTLMQQVPAVTATVLPATALQAKPASQSSLESESTTDFTTADQAATAPASIMWPLWAGLILTLTNLVILGLQYRDRFTGLWQRTFDKPDLAKAEIIEPSVIDAVTAPTHSALEVEASPVVATNTSKPQMPASAKPSRKANEGDRAAEAQRAKDDAMKQQLAQRQLQPIHQKSSFDQSGYYGQIEIDEIDSLGDTKPKLIDDDGSENHDRVWRATIYMNYGQFHSAETLLLEELQQAPDNNRIVMLLLDIYASTGQQLQFDQMVKRLTTVDAAAEEYIKDLRRQLLSRNSGTSNENSKQENGSKASDTGGGASPYDKWVM